MLVGPMKRKVVLTAVISCLIPIVVLGVLGFILVKNYRGEIEDLKKQSEVVNRYVLKEDRVANSVITADDVELAGVKSVSAPLDSYEEKADPAKKVKGLKDLVGRRLKINARKNTILSEAMFYEEDKEPTIDLRLQEFNMITLPSDLVENDYIDVRVRFPSGEDYSVLEAADAAQCRYMLSNNDIDLVILDIMLPDGDGISLCREIKAKYDIPILFLSALSENDDIITALRAGGDDYLPKPYDIQVLIARVEARLRSVRKDKRYISFGRLRLDTFSMAAYFADNDLLTTQKEFSILLMLARNIGSTVPKAELYENVWGLPYSDNANALFTAVSRLNKKLDDNKADVTITYERGKGYALESI